MSASEPVPQDSSETPPAPELRFVGRHIRALIFLLIIAIVLLAVAFRQEFTDIQQTVRTLGYPAIFAL